MLWMQELLYVIFALKKGYTLAQIASKINISTSAVHQAHMKFNRQNNRYKILELIRKNVEERY